MYCTVIRTKKISVLASKGHISPYEKKESKNAPFSPCECAFPVSIKFLALSSAPAIGAKADCRERRTEEMPCSRRPGARGEDGDNLREDGHERAYFEGTTL